MACFIGFFARGTELNNLRDIASAMRDGGMPDALIHATLPENTHIPALIDWVDKPKISIRSQLRSFQTGSQSSAERRKQQNDREKIAAAKKPFTPKAVNR